MHTKWSERFGRISDIRQTHRIIDSGSPASSIALSITLVFLLSVMVSRRLPVPGRLLVSTSPKNVRSRRAINTVGHEPHLSILLSNREGVH